MLGLEVPKNIKNWDYEQTRCNLLVSSAGFRRLMKRFKTKFRTSTIPKSELDTTLMIAEAYKTFPIGNSVFDICTELSVPTDFLERVILGDYDHGYVGGDSSPIEIVTESTKLRDGFYIRVDRHTYLNTTIKAHKEIKEMWKRHDEFVIKDHAEDTRQIERPVGKIRERPLANLELKYYIYNLVENKIYELMHIIEKRPKKPKDEPEDDDSDPDRVVRDAIESTSETLIEEKLSSAKNYMKGFPTTRSRYYSVLNYYNIPTLKQFEKFNIR